MAFFSFVGKISMYGYFDERTGSIAGIFFSMPQQPNLGLGHCSEAWAVMQNGCKV
jgi:hypothetical protein